MRQSAWSLDGPEPLALEMKLEARWRVKGLSLTERRAWVGVALVPALLSVANYQFQWVGDERWLSRFVAIGFVILFGVMLFIGPTVDEIATYRDSNKDSP